MSISRSAISAQRRRNELKVGGGAEHTSAEGASSVEGSGGNVEGPENFEN